MSGLLRGWIVTALEQLPVLIPVEKPEVGTPPEDSPGSVEYARMSAAERDGAASRNAAISTNATRTSAAARFLWLSGDGGVGSPA